MSYFNLHCLTAWILPPGLNILIAIIGFVISFFWKKVGHFLIFFSTLSLWIFSAPIFSYNLIDFLQKNYSPLILNNDFKPQQNSAIVILGGGTLIEKEYGNRANLSNTTFNRLKYGVYLHKKTNLPLILSAGRTSPIEDSGAAVMFKSLKDDFNLHQALLEDKSINTAEEAQYLVPILKQNNIQNVYLVTNAWHMLRSEYLFQKQGIHVIPAPMGYEIYDHHYSLLSFFPDIHALNTTNVAFHEFIGLLTSV